MQTQLNALVNSVQTLQTNLQQYADQANTTRTEILQKINNLESFEEVVVEETAASDSPNQA